MEFTESKSVSAANMPLMSVWFHHTKHTSWEERGRGERRGEKRGEAERGRKECLVQGWKFRKGRVYDHRGHGPNLMATL